MAQTPLCDTVSGSAGHTVAEGGWDSQLGHEQGL